MPQRREELCNLQATLNAVTPQGRLVLGGVPGAGGRGSMRMDGSRESRCWSRAFAPEGCAFAE
jgi:hypothetical protein